MRRLVLLVLATSACAHAASSEREFEREREQPAPAVWVERPPVLEPDSRVDAAAWTGEWTEYFPGRGICQDRFTLEAVGPSIAVELIDCTTELAYTITEIHWDGETLRFVATAPDAPMILHYTVTLDGPEQIAGTANQTPITWSRTK